MTRRRVRRRPRPSLLGAAVPKGEKGVTTVGDRLDVKVACYVRRHGLLKKHHWCSNYGMCSAHARGRREGSKEEEKRKLRPVLGLSVCPCDGNVDKIQGNHGKKRQHGAGCNSRDGTCTSMGPFFSLGFYCLMVAFASMELPKQPSRLTPVSLLADVDSDRWGAN